MAGMGAASASDQCDKRRSAGFVHQRASRRRAADMRKSTPAGQISLNRANVSGRHNNTRDSVTHYRSTAHWQRKKD